MPANQTLQQLRQIQDQLDNDATTVSLVFSAKASGDPPTFLVRRVQLHQRLLGDFRSISSKTTKAACECGPISYDPSYKPDSYETMFIELASNDRIRNLVNSLLNIDGLELMADDPDYFKHILFYGIVLKANGHDLLLLSSISPQNVLRRSRKLGIFFQNGIYDRLETEVLLLDREIDCLAFEGYMYILNMAGFHRISQYHEEVISTASDVIDAAAARIPISNLDDLKDIGTRDYRMAAKLASIKNKPYIATLTLDKVRQVIQQHNLPIVIELGTDGIEKLVFDPDPQKRFLILKVLDDDYLHSNMTDQNYAVNSKIPSTT